MRFTGTISSKISTLCVRFSVILAVFAGLLLPANLSAQVTFQPNWVLQSPVTVPPVRSSHAMAYDAAHGQVVLFGGNGSSVPLNDTWVWDGSAWIQKSLVAGPPARSDFAMAYDATHGQVVLFGGGIESANPGEQPPSLLNDTWVWDGANWTNVTPSNPANSPSPREDYAMAYDAAHGQVVLFGGVDNSGPLNDTWVWNGTNWSQLPATGPTGRAGSPMAYDSVHGRAVLFGGLGNSPQFPSDTWVWDGANWTQESPASHPSPHAFQAMAYDASNGKTIMFGGYAGGNPFNDTWVWDGSNWTLESPAGSPPARYMSAMAYDAAHGQLVLFGGFSADLGGAGPIGDTWIWGQGDFGSQAIGSTSATQTLNFSISSGTAVGSIGVLTQGAPSLDFTDASGSTCTAKTYGSDTNCTINVKFKPAVAGLREGAVVFFSGSGLSGTQLASVPIYGVGTGPQIAYGPGTAIAIDPTVNGNALDHASGVAVDGAGDLFIADYVNHRMLEVPAGGGAAFAVATGGLSLVNPYGAAVDGAGDLYTTDYFNNRVVEVPAGGGSAIAIDPTAGGESLSSPRGVAVDGAGDLFIADFGNNRVVEVPAGGGAAIAIDPTLNGNSLFLPTGVAVDGAGDLFIADFENNRVVEVPAGAGAVFAIDPTVNGSSLSHPSGVAVDGAGDLFIADDANNRIVEVPAGGGAAVAIDPTVNGLALNGPFGVTVDGTGDLFIADLYNNRVVEIQMSQPPTLNFPTSTMVGQTDTTDGAMAAEIINIGNGALNFSNFGYPTDFPGLGPESGSCLEGTPLSPGEECDVSVSFAPENVGSPLSENVTLTDNNLNVSGAQQQIPVTGTGATPTLSATCSSTNAGTVNVPFSSGPESVMGGVPDYTFYVGSGTVPNGLTLTTSTGAITGTPGTSGAFSIAVKDRKGTVAATTCPFTMVAPPLVVTWPTPAAITYQTPLSGTQLDASANEPGSFSYDPGAGTEFAAGPQTLHATFTPTDTKDYSVTPVQVTIQVSKATPVVSWSPALLSIDGKLTAAQLDATANVKGKFVYTPALGTEIKTATETLKVVFTPTDSKDYNIVDKTVSLPVSVIKVSPTSINYGTVKLGSVTTRDVTVTNLGTAAVKISNPVVSILTSGDSREFVAQNLCPASLAAHKSCTIKVEFVAGAFYHQQSATLSVMDSSPGSPQKVSLTALTKKP